MLVTVLKPGDEWEVFHSGKKASFLEINYLQDYHIKYPCYPQKNVYNKTRPY